MQTASETVNRPARNSSRTCKACKERKRKCGRELPSCHFCCRKKVECDYSKAERSVAKASNLKNVSSGHGSREPNIPAVFFLDSKLFQHSRMEIPKTVMPIPSSVISLIGDTTAKRLFASEYFESIHIWLPFISKMGFYKNVLNPLATLRADVALLLLCMKLIVGSPSEHEATDDPQSMLYLSAKRFLLDVELTGILTLQASQACILLTLYELGHAIYPSAYISIGACARYVTALGIDGKRRSHTTDAAVWIKQEEQRRTWWAVVILDRFSNLGCPERPLLIPELGPDALLPVDDIAWNEGTITYNAEFTIFSPANINMGMFARFCQATNLLAHALRHVSDTISHETFHSQEAIQLDRTIHSLINLTKVEGNIRQTTVCLQTAVCYSALMVLHSSHPLAVRETLSDEVIVLSRAFLSRITQHARSGDNVSPLLLYWTYQAASIYASLYRETGDEKHLKSWEILEETLRTLNKRWMVAGAYIQILEARNSMDFS